MLIKIKYFIFRLPQLIIYTIISIIITISQPLVGSTIRLERVRYNNTGDGMVIQSWISRVGLSWVELPPRKGNGDINSLLKSCFVVVPFATNFTNLLFISSNLHNFHSLSHWIMILPFDRDSSGMKEKVTVGWKIETECSSIECTSFRWVEVSARGTIAIRYNARHAVRATLRLGQTPRNSNAKSVGIEWEKQKSMIRLNLINY